LEENGKRFHARPQVHVTWKRSLGAANPDTAGNLRVSMVHTWSNPQFKVQNLLKLGGDGLGKPSIAGNNLALCVSTHV
jgi:hypothetical protein